MRILLTLAIACAASTGAGAVTFNFPAGNSIEHTSAFDGTVSGANAGAIGLRTTGDYIQDSVTFQAPFTFDSYAFTAPLIDYSLTATENFVILVNGAQIGTFAVTPQAATSGTISGSGNVTPITLSGTATLRVQLTNTIAAGSGSIGAGTGGRFTINQAAAAAVPEPASWAMFIGGFGLVGGALRRRRVQVGFA